MTTADEKEESKCPLCGNVIEHDADAKFIECWNCEWDSTKNLLSDMKKGIFVYNEPKCGDEDEDFDNDYDEDEEVITDLQFMDCPDCGNDIGYYDESPVIECDYCGWSNYD